MLLEAEEEEGHAEVFTFAVLADEAIFPSLPVRNLALAPNHAPVNHSLPTMATATPLVHNVFSIVPAQLALHPTHAAP